MALRRESSRYGAWRLKLHRPAQEFQRPKGAASYWPQCGVLEVNAWPVSVDGKTESSVWSQASGKARSTFPTWTPTSPLGKASAAFGWAQAPWSARGHGLRVARLVCDQRVGTACPVSGPTRAGWRCAVNTCRNDCLRGFHNAFGLGQITAKLKARGRRPASHATQKWLRGVGQTPPAPLQSPIGDVRGGLRVRPQRRQRVATPSVPNMST